MFNCQSCGKTAGARVKSQLVVSETRPKNYHRRPKANKKGADDPGGEGHEIVKMLRIGPCCTGRADKPVEVIERTPRKIFPRLDHGYTQETE